MGVTKKQFWLCLLWLALCSSFVVPASARRTRRISARHHENPYNLGRYVGPSYPPIPQMIGYPRDEYYNSYYDSHEASQSGGGMRRQDSGENGGGDDGGSPEGEAGNKDKDSEKNRYPRPDYSGLGPFIHDMKKNEPDFHRDLWLKVNFLRHKKGTEKKLRFAKALKGYTRWVNKGFPYRGFIDYTYRPLVPKKNQEFKLRKPGKHKGETLVIG